MWVWKVSKTYFIRGLNASFSMSLVSTRIWSSLLVPIFCSPLLYCFIFPMLLDFSFSHFSPTLLPLYTIYVCINKQLDYTKSFIVVSTEGLHQTTSPWLCSTNLYQSCKVLSFQVQRQSIWSPWELMQTAGLRNGKLPKQSHNPFFSLGMEVGPVTRRVNSEGFCIQNFAVWNRVVTLAYVMLCSAEERGSTVVFCL